MRIEDGFTKVPSRVLRNSNLKELTNQEFRALIGLYHLVGLNWIRNNIVVVTTLTKLKALLGYSKSNLSVLGLQEILHRLEQYEFITALSIAEDGKVSATLEHSMATGSVFMYNNRLIKGDSKLKDGELRVFLFILSYGQHKQIKITQEYMATMLGVDADTIRNNVNKLVAKDLIGKWESSTLSDAGLRTHLTYTLKETVDFKHIQEVIKKEKERKNPQLVLTDEIF